MKGVIPMPTRAQGRSEIGCKLKIMTGGASNTIDRECKGILDSICNCDVYQKA